jgi:hypothetical protein
VLPDAAVVRGSRHAPLPGMKWLLACVILGTSSIAAASPAPAFDQPHIAAEAMVGLGTPVGSAGGALILAPHRSVSLELGVGISLHEQHRQTSAMVRYRPWTSRFAPSFAAGLSDGDYTWYYSSGIIGRSRKDWDDARWANAEISLDLSFDSTTLRFFGGLGHQLSHDGCIEQDWTNDSGLPAEDPNPRPCRGAGGTRLLYTGVAVRFATPLGL